MAEETNLILLVLIISGRAAAAGAGLLVTLWWFSMLWVMDACRRGDLTMTHDQTRKLAQETLCYYCVTSLRAIVSAVVAETMAEVRRWLVFVMLSTGRNELIPPAKLQLTGIGRPWRAVASLRVHLPSRPKRFRLTFGQFP